MKFGKDFFKILQLVIGMIRLVARVLGDNDDIANDDSVNGSTAANINKVIKEVPSANISAKKQAK